MSKSSNHLISKTLFKWQRYGVQNTSRPKDPISIPTPWSVLAYSDGVGVSKAEIFYRKYVAKLEFSEGWGGVQTKNHLWGRYGYFLEQHNHTIYSRINCQLFIHQVSNFLTVLFKCVQRVLYCLVDCFLNFLTNFFNLIGTSCRL